MDNPEKTSPWDARKARWYSEGLRYSDYAEKVVGVMEPLVKGCSSLLDIGAGCGALCIPLARLFEGVIALDPSSAMLDELHKAAESAGVENIQTECADWQAAENRAGEFDVVLCANVPGILDRSTEGLRSLDRHAEKLVFLILGTMKSSKKFYFDELWPLIYGTKPPEKKDYLTAYSELHQMGILANVMIVEYNFDQPFEDIEEAVLFWKNHMRLDGNKWDDTLREFLSGKMEDADGRLWARIPKTSAVVWWRSTGKE